jgi:hypothetical protein
MRLPVIAIVLTLLGGCAIVPLDYYYDHHRSDVSSYYGPPANDFHGSRYHNQYQGRGYGYRGDYYGYPR